MCVHSKTCVAPYSQYMCVHIVKQNVVALNGLFDLSWPETAIEFNTMMGCGAVHMSSRGCFQLWYICPESVN